MKFLFDRRVKEKDFNLGDLVLRWDIKRGDKRKHGKFNNLWFGPFKIAATKGNNIFILQSLHGELLTKLVNGHYPKHFILY